MLPSNQNITIGNNALKVVHKFCYLGEIILQNVKIDDEVMALIKPTPKGYNIDPATWEAEAVNRSRWHKVHHNNTAHFDGNATAQLITRLEA